MFSKKPDTLDGKLIYLTQNLSKLIVLPLKDTAKYVIKIYMYINFVLGYGH